MEGGGVPPTIRLQDGSYMPVLAYGTYHVHDAAAVRAAYAAGFRHFDCAQFYGNESVVGEALYGMAPREDLFITSKLWNDSHRPELVRTACERTLRDLGVGYLDLYLIHWPVAWRPGTSNVLDPKVSLADTWRAMEALVEEGLVRAIGVSNFGPADLEEVLAGCRVRPSVNQIELHPFHAQRGLVGWCRRRGVHVAAYRPLGEGKLGDLLAHPAVAAAAAAAGAGPHEVQRGVAAVVRSGSADHLAANARVLTWRLRKEDMDALGGLDRGERTCDPRKWGWKGFTWGGGGGGAAAGAAAAAAAAAAMAPPARAEVAAACEALARAREVAAGHAEEHRTTSILPSPSAAAPSGPAADGPASEGESEDGWALLVAKGEAKGWKDRLKKEGWLDPLRLVQVRGEEVVAPVDPSHVDAVRSAAAAAAAAGARIRVARAPLPAAPRRGGGGGGRDPAVEREVWAAVAEALAEVRSSSGAEGGEGREGAPRSRGGLAAAEAAAARGGALGLTGHMVVGDACVLPPGALRRVPWAALPPAAARRVKSAAARALGAVRLIMHRAEGGAEVVYGAGVGWVEWEEDGAVYGMDLSALDLGAELRPYSAGWAAERRRVAGAAARRGEAVAVLGAGSGEWALPFLSGPGGGRVHAFEAAPSLLAALELAVARSPAATACTVHPVDGWDPAAVAAAGPRCGRVLVPPPLGGRRAAALSAAGCAGGGWVAAGAAAWAAAAVAALEPGAGGMGGGAVHVYVHGVAEGGEAACAASALAALAAAGSGAGSAGEAGRSTGGGLVPRLTGWRRVDGALLAIDVALLPAPASASAPPRAAAHSALLPAASGGVAPPRPVPRVRVTSARDFEAVAAAGEPAVLIGLDMGRAPATWGPEYLAGAVPPERVVPVHVAADRMVDLAGHRKKNTKKNFQFVEVPFPELMRRMEGGEAARGLPPIKAAGERYYMRSVAAGKGPVHFPREYPELAGDIPLPSMLYGEGQYHSSVLRVASGGTSLWTHFDTHDNVLMEVVGRKRCVLWPPWSEPCMYVEGSSSRVEDIDDPRVGDKYPLFELARGERRECELGPGEALFLPALWFHHIASLEFTAAVNVFWRGGGLPREAFSPKDWYGNKDPVAATEAADLVARAAAALAALPEPYRSFYGTRAANSMRGALGLGAPLG